MTARKSAAEIAHAVYEEPLPLAEFERQLAAMLADREDKESIAELIAWFRRRYPTVEARLAYARRHAKRSASGRGLPTA